MLVRLQPRGMAPKAMRRRMLSCGIAGLCALFVPAALAHPVRSRPQVAALKVVCFALEPFAMLRASGEPYGITVDFAKLLAQEVGVPVDIRVLPYPRAVAMIVTGEADLIFAFQNDQLLQSARALGVVAVGEVVLLSRAGSQVTGVASLKGKSVGHVRGAVYDRELQNDPEIRKYETVSYEQTVRMLLAKRFDAALGVRVSMIGAIRHLGLSRDQFDPLVVLSRREMLVHYSLKRYDPLIAERLTKALHTLRVSGAVAALYKPYDDDLKK